LAHAKMESNMGILELMERLGTEEKCRTILEGIAGRFPKRFISKLKQVFSVKPKSGMTRRSDALLDYTTFGELSVIITSNWDLFTTILKNQRAVTRVLNNLNLLRGPVAHCCPISQDEIERLRLSVKSWFRMIG
jgi:hypothetical protein